MKNWLGMHIILWGILQDAHWVKLIFVSFQETSGLIPGTESRHKELQCVQQPQGARGAPWDPTSLFEEPTCNEFKGTFDMPGCQSVA